MYKEFGISEKLEALANETENEVKEIFKQIEANTIKNSIKVLKAFQNKGYDTKTKCDEIYQAYIDMVN